jgi:hypothetical protein
METKKISNVEEFLNKTTNKLVVMTADGEVVKELSEKDVELKTKYLIDVLLDEVKIDKDFGKAQAALKLLLETKKIYWPSLQKSLVANVDVFNDQLQKWIQTRKTIIIGNDDMNESIKKEVDDALENGT